MNQPDQPRAIRVKWRALAQFIRYGIVGVFNTAITLAVIFICKSVLGVPEMASNAIGYTAGLINSFIWNKTWVFKSKGAPTREALRFFVGFIICYALQFVVVWALNAWVFNDLQWYWLGICFTGYAIATFIGNVVYTVANFVYNRVVTFV